jgi:FkbM family methyltransferase
MISQPPRAPGFALAELSLRARLTYAAHLWKAVFKQHHTALLPIIRPLIPKDGVVFDIGSHAGQYTKLFARLVPQGQVWSFEPAPYALSILRPAVRLNRLQNVAIRTCGLGDREGEFFLSTPLKEGGSYRFGLAHLGEETRNARRQRVPITTIDRVVAEEGIERVDFIKADIEGWELRMLHGGETAIARFEPALLLEVNGKALARAGDSAAALWDFLRRRGYRPWRLGDPGPSPPDAAPAEGDILWLPRRGRIPP